MRSSGILLHISSLPSPCGIGTLGREAYNFVDFLKNSGQSFWQVLPVGTTSYGDSPYQSFSTFAGNPYFVDLDLLCEDGLLFPEDYNDLDFGDNPTSVDYSKLFTMRNKVLYKAYQKGFERDKEKVLAFCEQQLYWIEDYALYMALKEHFNYKSYREWDADIRKRDAKAIASYKSKLSDKINFHKYVQYLFFTQWESLKTYANKNNVRIIGDIPINVADDSADTWSNKELFWLDEDCTPVKVAGVPPDAFSDDGQLWGNPVYAWEAHKKQGYKWWLQRLSAALELFDVVRIDHFRGFESYYAIDYGATNARVGEWYKAPGQELFALLKKQTRGFKIIAEDLGYITPEVRKLLRDTGFPGMKIMMFGFNAKGESDFIPYKHTGNCVSYIGTHDNETFLSWLENCPPSDRALAKRYMRLNKREGYHWGAIRTLLETGSTLAIIQMQDILGLGNEARMNLPATLGGNWQWRLSPDDCTDEIARKLHALTKTYGRLDKQK